MTSIAGMNHSVIGSELLVTSKPGHGQLSQHRYQRQASGTCQHSSGKGKGRSAVACLMSRTAGYQTEEWLQRQAEAGLRQLMFRAK